MAIIELREQLNKVIRKKQLYAEAAGPLVDSTMVFTTLFAQHQTHEYSEAMYLPEHFEPIDEHAESVVGNSLWIFAEEFTNALFDHSYIGSNLRYRIKAITDELSTTSSLAEVEIGIEPSTEGWSDLEIQMVVDNYERQIHNLNLSLLTIEDTAESLADMRDVMPKWIKSSVMGMFGKPDLLSEFEYAEADFVYSYYDKTSKPQIMTAKWLAPIYGLDVAKKIEESINILQNEA